MTNPQTTERPALPTVRLDYSAGTFTNTLTGEQTTDISGVVLAYREDRVLWPTLSETDPRPLCVNGSEFGPCLCAFADWGPSGEAPDCSEELSILVWQDTQLVVLTARRSQLKVLTQYIEMQNLLGQPLCAQHVTVAMRPGLDSSLHRLTLTPGAFLDTAEAAKMTALSERVGAAFGGGQDAPAQR